MNAPATALFDRAERLGFPAVIIAGTVCAGAAAWELRLSRGGTPADLDQAAHQLADIEAQPREQQAREETREAAEPRDAVTAVDAFLADDLRDLSLGAGSTHAEAGLAADYSGSEQEERDVEAAEAFLARLAREDEE